MRLWKLCVPKYILKAERIRSRREAESRNDRIASVSADLILLNLSNSSGERSGGGLFTGTSFRFDV